MSGYTDGRRVEWAVVHDLKMNGYFTTRAASSKGMCDVVAIKSGQVLLISCKRTSMPGPAERKHTLRVASLLPGVGVPLVALSPRGKPLTYRRLVGAGPDSWIPWTPDEVA
jgi:hypothetical protein